MNALLSSPRLIGLDWGTSSLRGYLLGENGAIQETRARPWGILHTPGGDFAATFRDFTGDWRARWPGIPVLASGMIGSRQGWREVPYVECPADPARIAGGLLAFETGCGELRVVPGLLRRGELPDVLRGEETQIIGAMALEPQLAAHALLVLPGTHSKWAVLQEGRIESFATHMTGEIFALLRDHSILGKPAQEEAPDVSREAFLRGVRNAVGSGQESASARLFTARSLFLTGSLRAAHTLEYLSGLLIGEELRSVLARFQGESLPPVVLLGDGALCERYREAMAECGIARVRALEHTAPVGLWQIALAAGLLQSGTSAALATPVPE
jgi:2-dehydro-3-deoxygalactonokinase